MTLIDPRIADDVLSGKVIIHIPAGSQAAELFKRIPDGKRAWARITLTIYDSVNQAIWTKAKRDAGYNFWSSLFDEEREQIYFTELKSDGKTLEGYFALTGNSTGSEWNQYFRNLHKTKSGTSRCEYCNVRHEKSHCPSCGAPA